MATPQSELAGLLTDPELDRMPSDLKERGWKLERKIVNDDEENPEFIARNLERGFATEAFPVPGTAIAAARKLDQNATPAIVELEIDKIDSTPAAQARIELDLETVDRYAEAKEAGVQFPPATVFYDGTAHYLGDGLHRLSADKKIGKTTLRSEIRPGTKRDAILYALGANAAHGLPRSNADKRRAVAAILVDPEWSEWSDNVIAAKANVSQPFVSKLRRELTQNVLSAGLATDAGAPSLAEERPLAEDAALVDQPGQIQTPTSTKRRGHDGVVRETKNIGRTAREIPAEVDITPDVKEETEPETLFGGTLRYLEERVARTAPAKTDPDGWTDEPVNLHIQINAGKTSARRILVSGRHGDGKPLFRQAVFAELEPIPIAIAGILDDLKKACARRGKAKAAPAKKTSPKHKARKK